jgi:hypothetical protein
MFQDVARALLVGVHIMTLASSEMKQESIHGLQFICYWNVGSVAFERACPNSKEARFHNTETLCEGIILQKRFVK